jgi:hypothetical protein
MLHSKIETGPPGFNVRIFECQKCGGIHKTTVSSDLEVGDRVRLIAKTLAWRAEMTLRGKMGEVIERRGDGRVSIRFHNGRLLLGRDTSPFEHVWSADGLR